MSRHDWQEIIGSIVTLAGLAVILWMMSVSYTHLTLPTKA